MPNMIFFLYFVIPLLLNLLLMCRYYLLWCWTW